ncbi:MAG: PDZ domain-containing protein [Gemmatimonadetes bacterium]|nr:PDZ domain-containing protein [Gemmatimonadota bacterium]MYB97335.1 PDZ domain-containing protein [Gemmatimonadota bacterium]MYI47275.1 PDZ domain-containing protein [Gemmatimonadota bacterium]
MSKGKTVAVPAVIAVLAVASGGWLLQRNVGLGANLYVQVRVLEEVVNRIERHFVDEVDVEQLYDAALEGVVQSLNDPNSALLQAPDWEDMQIRTSGEYGGVGLEVASRDGFVTVLAPVPGTPGYRAGLRPGDRIVEVEGESVVGWTTDQVAQLLRGEPGTSVRMGVRRHAVDHLIPYEITRAVIQLSAVPFALLFEGGVGYVPIEIFNGTTSSEVSAKVDSLVGDGMESLILDLRRNRGGLLLEGVGLSDMFLDAGSSIVEVRGRTSAVEHYRAGTDQEYPGMPVVVLVDYRSASASEIFAGALQDHDRALLIGAPTFGKGSVQSLFPVSAGRVLKLTTARWFTPSGRSIQKEPREQLLTTENGVITRRGEAVQYPDLVDRPRFNSAGGRVLYGGGGIVPDLWVLQDTLTVLEDEAVRKIIAVENQFLQAMHTWAVRYRQEHPGLEPGFVITDQDLAGFHALLVEREVEMTLENLRQARRTVEYLLGSEVALQAWEDRGRFVRYAALDTQLQRAIELLLAARNPEDLFRLAGLPSEGSPQVGGGLGGRDGSPR